MFKGEEERIELINVVIDKFGAEVDLTVIENNKLKVDVII